MPATTRPYGDALSLSHRALRFLVVANWVFGAAILAMLISTFLAATWVARALGVTDEPRMLLGMRAIMALAVGAAPVANVFFSRLLAIVETVRDGDPFIAANAARLQAIAWAVLALEVIRLVIAAIAKALSTPARPIDIDWKLSVTPWLSVLLLFVLSRVFEQGARMREELEGTV